MSAEQTDAVGTGQDEQQAPMLKFVGGNPTPEEVAAVTAVVLSATAETETAAGGSAG